MTTPFENPNTFRDKASAKAVEQPGQNVVNIGGGNFQVTGTPVIETAGATPAAATGSNIQAGESALSQAAARASQEAANVYGLDTKAPKQPQGLTGASHDIATSAIEAWEAQKPVVEAQAKKAKEGLDMALGAGLEYDAALREHIDRVQDLGESAAAGYDAVVQKVEGNAQLAAWNVGEGLRQIEGWAKDIMDRLDVNKARDIATGMQSTIQGMNNVDREMQAKYGRDSDEYRQYQMDKAASFGSIMQTVQTTYANNISQIGVQFAYIKAKYKAEAEMFASFDRQGAGTVAKDMALAKSSLFLQVASDIASTNMLITANQENMANWVIETPVFGMDTSDLVAFMGSIAMEREAQYMAVRAAKETGDAARSAGKMSMWGSIAGAAITGGASLALAGAGAGAAGGGAAFGGFGGGIGAP